MNHLVGCSKNGSPVYIDLTSSAAVKAVSRQPHLLSLAAEGLRVRILQKGNATVECNLRRNIGYDFVIDTTDENDVFYVCLIKDSIPTRFTKKGMPETTSYITLCLEFDSDKDIYNLVDLWVGRSRPVEPGRSGESDKSIEYWKNHAVVFQNQPIQTQTLTKECPY